MRSVQALAQIRLNLTGVDQFLAIACGLADDNPDIKERVYAAAAEVRAAALLIDHLRNLFSHQASVERGQVEHYADFGPSERAADANARRFTYSNQLTLVRASKSLVANVATILYLTDSILPQGQPADDSPPQQQSRAPFASIANKQAPHQQQLAICDRLDNVANYSQLLRSFGELSCELVDLGHCIMLSNHCRAREDTSGEGEWPQSANCQPSPVGQTAQVRPSASVSLELAGRQRRYRYAGLPPALQESGPGEAELLEQVTSTREAQQRFLSWPTSASAASKPKALQLAADKMERQIQDMQTLFQVNRLTIDRSILLLLSASKSCLWLSSHSRFAGNPPNESLLGLAARRSIVVQIRASISIIMAIVKCSVFSGATCAGLPELQQQSNFIASQRGFQQELSKLKRDDQFDYHYLACQSPLKAESVIPAQLLSCHLEPAPSGGLEPPRAAAEYLGLASSLGGQAANLGANKLAHLGFDPRALDRAPASQRNPSGLARAPDSTPQIMNYFLQTWNATQSAYDAINKLQLLVEPLARLQSYKCLVRALDAVFAKHFRATSRGSSAQVYEEEEDLEEGDEGEDKENAEALDPSRPQQVHQQQAQRLQKLPQSNFMLMNRRQLISTLNSIFLDELKANLVEPTQEFTDCPYTKHEQREVIVLLLHCLKIQLNRLVKFIYRLRRKASVVNELNIGQLRQLASQLDDTCAELKCELQTVVIELSDELDRANGQLELVKQLKLRCLAGDSAKVQLLAHQFREQADQLVEACKMLNQVAPTHKLKITSKSLAIWFEMNCQHLLAVAQSLALEPRSRVAKDCAWAYFQVWCSFYDDFCQLARQLAYLSHAQYDAERSARVLALQDQVLIRRQMNCPGSAHYDPTADELAALCTPRAASDGGGLAAGASVQSLNLLAEASFGGPATESPRSLDHYYGFGANYHRYSRAQQPPEVQPLLHPQQQPPSACCSPETSCSLCPGDTPPAALPPERRPLATPAPGYPPPELWLPAAEGGAIQAPRPPSRRVVTISEPESAPARPQPRAKSPVGGGLPSADSLSREDSEPDADQLTGTNTDQQSSAAETDKWSDSDADAIVRGAKETAQMALSMYQFTKGEGELNTTQDLFTQAELFAEEANELYKEVRCFSYKVPAGELKKELLAQLGAIPALVQQLQFIVKNPTVGKPATFAKVDSVIRETKSLMEAVNRVVTATLSCRQHYNMAIASMRKRTRTLSPSYRGDKGFEFENHSSARQSTMGGRHAAGTMGSEPDI